MEKKVEIEWVDSVSAEGWQHRTFTRCENLTIQSIGYLVHEDKTSVTISSCRMIEGNFRAPVTIPKIAIVKRRVIK